MDAAPDGSIMRRDAPRADLLAFEVKDRITRADIEWMSSIADGAMRTHNKIDMLIIMSNFEGADVGAKFDGYAVGVQAKSVAHINRTWSSARRRSQMQ